MITIDMKIGLFPATTLVRMALAIEIGQLTPNATSISTSKILILPQNLQKLSSQDQS